MLRKLNAVVVVMTTSNAPISTAAIFVAAGAWQRVYKEFYRMKKVMICLLLTVAMACCGTALYAQMQDQGQAPPPGQAGGGMQRMPMSTDQRLQHMTQMLNLSSDQQMKIRPILDNESQQMQALRSDTSMSRDDRMTKMKSIRENTNSQIVPILTSQQQQKWQQMQQMQSQHRGPQGGAMGAPGGDQGAPPAPPQQ
jgi:protein CpxP